MGWIGAFNIVYGALGLLAASYLGRTDGIALCIWVMTCGAMLRLARPVLDRRRFALRRRRVLVRARSA